MMDLASLYAETYYVFQKDERTRYAQAFSQVKRHLDPNLGLPRKPLDILEVGSATGHLLHVLRHLNHRIQGVELSSSAAESARKRFGVDVFNGSIEEYVSKAGHGKMQHDVVWCNDVLEHVPDPVSFVKSCAMALKPAGRLILDTPNAGAKAVREGKPNWDGYNPYHIYLFGPENIELLLDKAGFRVQAKFSFRNGQSMGLVPRQPLRSSLRNTLKTTGLLEYLRRIRQLRLKSRDGELARQPMKAGEIVRRLEEIPWFSDSDDAREKLAEDCRGNNLVVHAVLA
jgi:SAM-dependent methyltransferase